MEERKPLYTVSGNVHWYSHYGKQYGISSKNWKQSSYDLGILLYVLRKLNQCVEKVATLLCSLQCYTQNLESTSVPAKENVVYVHIMEFDLVL